MELVKENGKFRIYKSGEYTISIWDGGSIVIKTDDFIKVDHNPKNMKLLGMFLKGTTEESKSSSFFITPNVVASELLSSLTSFKYESVDDKIVLDTWSKDQNVSRDKNNNLKFPKPKKSSSVAFSRNTRYEVSEVDGRFVYLEEMEPITIRNIFKKYSEPLINVY